MKNLIVSNKRSTPKKFFPKIRNSKKEFNKNYKKKIHEDGLDKKYSMINPLKFAIAFGIMNSLMVFLVTLSTIFSGNSGIITTTLESIYGGFGYSISGFGALFGAIYIFFDTAVISYIFIRIYNKLL